MDKYDLCVIGGGPAGYATAMRAIDLGKKVVLVEKDKIGGAGLYNGALSSKTMWEFAKKINSTRKSFEKRELLQNFYDVTWEEVLNVVDRAVFDRKQQLSTHLKILQKDADEKLFVHERGFAKLVSNHEILIENSQKEVRMIWANKIAIATGSVPRKLPHIPIDEKIIITSDGISQLKDFPKSVVILGAGVIGCEFATIFSDFGKTKVHIIDKAERILPFEDEDIAKMVTTNLEKNGVVVHKNSSLLRMEIIDGEVEYELQIEGEENQIIRVEKAIISVGRVPNVRGFGLEEVGVKINDRGLIENEDGQTSVSNIYAVGDVSGNATLVNVAEVEGRHAAKKMFGVPTKVLRYDYI